MRNCFLTGLLFLIVSCTNAQYAKVYPTGWFVGMKWNKVQVIVQGTYEGFNQEKVRISYPGVQLQKVHQFENSKYLALDLLVAPSAKPGNVPIEFIQNSKAHAINWPLKARRANMGKDFAQGITQKDFVYLLMPDRFSNGDSSNDRIKEYRDTTCNSASPILRHGGDLQGIQNRLDYLSDLGVTALWLTPVIENDMPLQNEQAGMVAGYHGYWFTNHYAIDKRFGGDAAYKNLINAAHSKGIKIIQDAVYNHIGIEHWMYKDAPSKDWVNQWDKYTSSNHRDEALYDINGSAADKKIMLDGWFVPHLPDINQRNPFVANYLIQHALWTVEEYGIDGWRVDTYKYCDEAFLNKVNTALENDFPSITIVGEAVANTVTGSAYFAKNNMQPAFKHNLQSLLDFPLSYSMMDAINQPFGWTNGVNKLYMTLSQDFLYKAPEKNWIFLDNHDTERFISMIDQDMNKFKMGMNLLFTLRGTPHLYYGTEVWMKNFKDPNDGMVRLNFPGGFNDGQFNKFLASGRNKTEEEAFSYVKKLANYRKNNTALQTGKLMQWIPKDGVYVYFRYNADQTFMIVFNSSKDVKEVKLNSFQERTKNYSKGVDIVTDKQYGTSFSIGPKESMVLKLQ
ncbi:MAG: alpha-amylase [Sphingobacteriia bacterium]|nr:MAG: alpha-amylase [Sphingobacteriia bacterium]